MEGLTESDKPGILLKAKDGSFETRVVVNQQGLITSVVLKASPKALASEELSAPSSLQAVWLAGTITTEKDLVIASLRSRLAALDKHVEKYDHVRLSPAGQPQANFVQVQTTLKDRIQSLVHWLRKP